MIGLNDGRKLMLGLALIVGACVGRVDGELVGLLLILGDELGAGAVGLADREGARLGASEGTLDGVRLGRTLGLAEGT